MTHNFCRTLAARPEVSVELLLPENSDTKSVPAGIRARCILPSWVPTFFPGIHRSLPFAFPGLSLETDVIHAFVEFPYAILAWRVARRLRRPYLISAHGTYGVSPLRRVPDRWFFRRAVASASSLITGSRFTLNAMVEEGAQVRDGHVIPNPVDFDRYQRPIPTSTVATRLGIAPTARVILSVGAIKSRKGFDVLIRALALVGREEPSAHLVITGKGDTGSLRELARTLGIEDKVHFASDVGNDELVSLYQQCDVFALLPRKIGTHFEGFGLVYQEAGACGKPVVGTRSGGVPEAIIEGETGLIVPEDDPPGAANALLRLLKDRDLASRLGQAGLEIARGNSWSRYADQMIDLYHRAVRSEAP